MSFAILWPAIAMVALIFVVWFVMYVQRFALMKRRPPRPEDFASGEAALRYFQPVEAAANNLRNLFEMPVLFFALIPLLLVTATDSVSQILFAWFYVGLRAAHSWVQIAVGKVPPRFLVYLASCVVLAAMWVGFAIDMALATR